MPPPSFLEGVKGVEAPAPEFYAARPAAAAARGGQPSTTQPSVEGRGAVGRQQRRRTMQTLGTLSIFG
jgi:hypothetical protein